MTSPSNVLTYIQGDAHKILCEDTANRAQKENGLLGSGKLYILQSWDSMTIQECVFYIYDLELSRVNREQGFLAFCISIGSLWRV